MLELIAYSSLALWIALGGFLFYTTVRDDIRNEKERKEKKQ